MKQDRGHQKFLPQKTTLKKNNLIVWGTMIMFLCTEIFKVRKLGLQLYVLLRVYCHL